MPALPHIDISGLSSRGGWRALLPLPTHALGVREAPDSRGPTAESPRALLLPVTVHPEVARDSDEPRAGRFTGPDFLPVLPQPDEGFLGDILSFLVMAQVGVDEGVDPVPLMFDCLFVPPDRVHLVLETSLRGELYRRWWGGEWGEDFTPCLLDRSTSSSLQSLRLSFHLVIRP